MSRFFVMAAAVGALMACAATAQPNAMAAPVAAPMHAFDSDVSCDIRVTRTSHSARFTAFASGDSAVDYELTITKRDRGGSSDIMQAGYVDLAQGDERLGEAEISLERGGDFEARLVVLDQGDTVCEAEELS